MKYIIITKKLWQKFNYKNLDKRFIVQNTIDSKLIKKIKPKIIFFIHWSKLIPSSIYKKYLCIQFHTSDLPKFRGGSPIQNQIINNIKNTKITAFKINSIIDSGEICLKKNIELSGSAQKIYIDIEKKVIQMIHQIIKKKKLKFTKQYGKGSYYKRRRPEDSKMNLDKISKSDLTAKYSNVQILNCEELRLSGFQSDVGIEEGVSQISGSFKYGSLALGGETEKIDLILYQTKLRTGDIQEAKIHGSYTSIATGNVDRLTLTKSYQDHYELGKVGELVGMSKYTSMNIKKLSKSMTLESFQGKISIDEVLSEFEKLNIESKYTPVSLVFNSKAKYNLDATTKYTTIKTPDSNFEKSYEREEYSSKDIKGIFNPSSGKEASLVYLNSFQGRLILK